MRFVVVLGTLLGLWLVATSALAEGGYFSGTLGTRATGRGGAFVARADDVTAVTYNPAGLADLHGTLIELGNAFSYNAYSYTRAPTIDYGNPDPQSGEFPRVTFAKVSNGQPWQALDPLAGVASNLGLENWGFALAAFAPSGISQESFPSTGGQRYMMVSRESIILEYVASIAWKFRDVFGLGASAEWIHVPRLSYSLYIDGDPLAHPGNPVTSTFDILATVKGSAPFTFNAILGAWYRPVPFLELGVSGQVVPANVVAHSTLSVVPDSQSIGDVTLYRNGVRANDVTLTLPLPMLFRGGARYRHLQGARELYDLELDVEYETWSRVKRFAVDTNVGNHDLQAEVQSHTIDIGTINIEKHWRDTVTVRLGGDYAVIPDRLTLRGGGYYESAVADPAYANVDFSGGPQIGGSVGASIFFGQVELALAYQLRVQPSVSVSEDAARVYQQVPGSSCEPPYTDQVHCNQHYLNQPSPVVNAGTYSAVSHFVAFDLLYRYGP